MRSNGFDRLAAGLLVIIGIVCLLQGASKPLLWFAGSRTSGHITGVATEVSRTGAISTHYSFQTAGGETVRGTAMAAGSLGTAQYRTIHVAYLEHFPDINMPAYGGYAAFIGIGWTLVGLFAAGVGLMLRKKSREEG